MIKHFWSRCILPSFQIPKINIYVECPTETNFLEILYTYVDCKDSYF
jgi:hypothetical protein